MFFFFLPLLPFESILLVVISVLWEPGAAESKVIHFGEQRVTPQPLLQC